MRIRYNPNFMFMLFLLLCIMVPFGLTLSGCSRDTPALQDITNPQQHQPQADARQLLEIVISHSQTPGTPEDTAARAMQSKLQALLGDTARVAVYADYQLGSSREQLEALQLGRIDIAIQPASAVSQLVPDMGVFQLPYLFPADGQAVIDLLSGSAGQDALHRMDDTDRERFTGLGLWFGGYKLLTFHGDDHKTIQSPADFQGLTIATSGAPITDAQYHHWGAQTISVDDIALYSTLEQHIADGTAGTAQQIVSNHLQEVQRVMVQAYHSPKIYVVLTNAKWYAALPTEVQDAIMEAEACAKEVMYQSLAEQEPTYLDTIAQWEGVYYTVLSEAQIEVFRQSVQSLYAEQLAGNPWMMEYAEQIKNASRETP